jgi:transcriptional regulator with XRE-family HTH domain
MSFQIELNPFERAYAHFVRQVREALQKTFAEEAQDGLTQKELAETLGVDEALVSRRLNGPGNITLRTLADLYTAMGREPLSNFECPQSPSVSVVPVSEMTVSTSTFSTARSPFLENRGTVVALNLPTLALAA